ncbi:MAG TPA: type II secretion system F family protein [Phycisphaerae bacterium]|nr:type II secretion system F family protein [Phycisphaerae bacterium]
MTQPDSTPTPAQFRYEAQTPDGLTVRGALEAATAADAHTKLAALGLRVLSVDPAPEPAPHPDKTTPLGPDDFLVFNQQLAHLTAAGLPVERGLRLIATDVKSGRLASAANAVAAELEKGVPLKDAFARHASRFPSLYARLVDAGIKAANLPAMLFNLGRHLELITRLRRALWRAFSYPVAVTTILSLVLLYISLVIVPMFTEIFRDFHTSLPALTQFFLDVGPLYPAFLATVAIVVAALLLIVWALRVTGKSGFLVDQIGLRLPVIGRVLHANLIARWCDSLRLGVEAGLDLPRAISLASESTGSARLAHETTRLTDALAAGRPIGDIHAGGSDLLPATVPAAFELASRAGDLPGTLGMLSRMYEEQAEQRLRTLPAIITPTLMIFVGGCIALTVISMFLPLVKLIQSVSG